MAQLQGLNRGDPWLTAGLLKDGAPIYLVKWETDWAAPRLFHIQSIADVELFGINGSNYGSYVLDVGTWEQRYGISVAGLPRYILPAATAPPAPPATPARRRRSRRDGTAFLLSETFAQVRRRDVGACWERGDSLRRAPWIPSAASAAGLPPV